jgi:uncharacterized membrane protein
LTFNHDVDDVVKIVEGAGVAILVIGALAVLLRSAILWLFYRRDASAYWYFRRHLGRVILLGLELLIIADIIRTVIVDPTPGNVAVLATIVAIRIVLSWSLEVEIDGSWPWKRGRVTGRWSGQVDEGPGPSPETISHPTGE